MEELSRVRGTEVEAVPTAMTAGPALSETVLRQENKVHRAGSCWEKHHFRLKAMKLIKLLDNR